MNTQKFEVDNLTIDLYSCQIRNLCEELRLNYWYHYQSIHALVWNFASNLGKYRKGADIDILSDLLYTLCRVQTVYIEAIKSGEFYSIFDCDIIEINDDI
ncbi:MAG: hypothetical protein KME22_07775 [Hassallia sp. WJT32-NPBG1]|jgi:hypothetical protein|nr:hypothetical protein [Hassallia sp. WJT32-NPBG1]